MSSQLNIKSEDAYRLASGLGAMTGENLTSVVTNAAWLQLNRRESAHDIDADVGRMLAIRREIRDHMTEPVSSDLSDLYYDGGFPR